MDLGTSRLGDDRIPAALERRDAVLEMIVEVGLDPSSTTIVEGLFLIPDGRYIALVEQQDGSRLAILDRTTIPIAAVMRELSPWRQLSDAVGTYLGTSGQRPRSAERGRLPGLLGWD